ncbi:anti-sigma factor [Pedobacter sp. KBW06]|uniref:FecR family protein n=1 Tax=Pedobacter sp. KBW06 TaxID=2153359 RepID=UPI000F5A6A6B|nr:FecR family protein [Pedobacter sp. KBW06]RQO74437.1 anti-sigma factor [Pedobacter sp. KBW06]
MDKPDIKDLLDRYKSGSCTAEERSLVESWYLTWDTGSFDLSEQELLADLALVKSELPGKRRHRLFYYPAVAAVAGLITLSIAVYWFAYNQSTDKKQVASINLIVPGSSKATLTLADGSTVVLDSGSTLDGINQFGVTISKSANGKLVYRSGKTVTTVDAYNTLSTPKGGQYEITLPDGTKVWLNAASKLRFPVIFTANERRVELIGEAYFEVVKDRNRPFKVKSDQQEITVLGTHFNVNAYGDEVFTKTTLLEGSVRVNKGTSRVLLMPGQQAVSEVSSSALTVRKDVDLSESIAWKNGLFVFEQEDVFSIMNKISRWYDIEVVYHGNLKGKKYSGNISKFEDVTEVLKTMQLTGTIQFKVEGRRIIVMP